QAPDRSSDEHLRVARWVLDNLINVGTTDRGFRRVYGAVDADGRYRRRAFDFKLLVELAAPDGEVYLRATDEAINVLVGALDTDVESAHIAAEVKLENLITRGRLADAKLAAEQARYRTVQYGEILRARLDATRRDVRSVDWERELPELLDSALTHIESRFRAETAILKNITAGRERRARTAPHLHTRSVADRGSRPQPRVHPRADRTAAPDRVGAGLAGVAAAAARAGPRPRGRRGAQTGAAARGRLRRVRRRA